MEKSSWVLTLLLLFCVQKVSGENCTTLLETCQSTHRLVPPSSRNLDEICKVDFESVESFCTSYKSFSLCVNNTMANCLHDGAISNKLILLQGAYNSFCTPETLCGSRIGKCYCEADLVSDFTNITKMCNNQKIFQECIRKIKDCDRGKFMKKSTLFITMMEAVCKTACPEAFKCFIPSDGQSGPSGTGNICSKLMPLLQCLTNNTRTCSASLNDKWQRVVTSYQEVCSEFYKYMTVPSRCGSIQTCVDKAKVVPGVTLGDWRSNTTVFITHTKQVTTGMLNPGTWCSILNHAMGCVDELADICNVSKKEKEKVASMKILVINTCKGTDVSTESETPNSGFEWLSSFVLVSFLLTAVALLKV